MAVIINNLAWGAYGFVEVFHAESNHQSNRKDFYARK